MSGPYCTPVGRRYLEDVLETMRDLVDSLKFVGSFTLMPGPVVGELIELWHPHSVEVSLTGCSSHQPTNSSAICSFDCGR
jgi:phosphosulfolactate synthase (CoM biosynthesis protein A)